MLSMRKLRVVGMGSVELPNGHIPVATVRGNRCSVEYSSPDGTTVVWEDEMSIDEAIAEISALTKYLNLQPGNDQHFALIRAEIFEKDVEIVHVGAGLEYPLFKENAAIGKDERIVYQSIVYDSVNDPQFNSESIEYFRNRYKENSRDPYEANEDALDLLDRSYFPMAYP